MSDPKNDPEFNETLRRMLNAPPKPHDEMKKGRKPKQEKTDEPKPHKSN